MPDPVSDEAVHAVARQLCYWRNRDWRYDPGNPAHDHWRVKARATLEAALPFLRPSPREPSEEAKAVAREMRGTASTYSGAWNSSGKPKIDTTNPSVVLSRETLRQWANRLDSVPRPVAGSALADQSALSRALGLAESLTTAPADVRVEGVREIGAEIAGLVRGALADNPGTEQK